MLYAQVHETPWTVRVGMQAASGSNDNLPFWLRANQYGTIDSTSANAVLRTKLTRRVNLNSDFRLAFGTDVLARASDHPTLFARASQLPGAAASSGPLGGSPHRASLTPPCRWARWAAAETLHRCRRSCYGTPSYVPVPGVERALAVKGYLAHGWFTGDRFVRDALLHEKYLYLRLLAPSSPIQLHAGILQHTVWGGTHPTRGPLPQDTRRSCACWAGSRAARRLPQPTSGGTIGSTEAGYDFGITLQTAGLEAHISRYFHHTDRPSLLFRNPWDGLWEVRVERASDQLVSTVLWEHLNATRHNAKYSEGEERGEDTYYNNSLYRGGWVHRGFTLGSPLLLPNTSAPGIANNIVLAHHLGIGGQLAPMWRYRVLATYSRHYGAQGVCADAACTQRVDRRTDRTDQYAARIEITRHVTDTLRLRTAVATDLGALYPDRVGVLVGLSWQGSVATPW